MIKLKKEAEKWVDAEYDNSYTPDCNFSARMDATRAYMAGAKAHTIQWHDLRKDGELPRQDGHTCFSIDVLSNDKKCVYYRFDSGLWFCGNKEVKVIAWCELPEYKE